MSKQFPQGCDTGEEWRDDDEVGLYKPTDTPSAVDGSLNKKKTFQSLREKLETAITNFSTGILTITGLFTVGASGITSTSTDINMQKDLTILGMSGSVTSRIDANTQGVTDVNTRVDDADSAIGDNDTEISALQNKTPQSYKTSDSVTFDKIASNKGYALSGNLHGTYTHEDIYNTMSSFLVNTGDSIIISGTYNIPSVTNSFSVIDHATRTGATEITLYGMRSDNGVFVSDTELSPGDLSSRLISLSW